MWYNVTIIHTAATRVFFPIHTQLRNGRNSVRSLLTDCCLLASATDTDESWPIQHTRFPSPENATARTQPPVCKLLPIFTNCT